MFYVLVDQRYAYKVLPVQIRNIKKDRKFNIKGGTVIDGFPSGGLVNAIASEFLISTVGMECSVGRCGFC